jgi:hypothetical protein
MRAASSPTSLADTPALSRISVSFLDALVPMSAGAALLRAGIGLNFNGSAQISAPSVALPNASFVAEAAPISVQKAPSAAATLTPHKLAAIVTLSRELLEAGSAEDLVRAALVEATGPALDAILFDANAATTTRPAGLLAGITPLAASAATEKSEAAADDLAQLALATASVGGNGNVVLVGSPDTMAAIKTRLPQTPDWPTFVSASLPPKTVIMVATNAIVSAIEGAPVVDASPHAEIHFETVPQEIVTAAGTVATPVASIYQDDTLALRLRWSLTWALRSSAGIAWVQNTKW